MSLLLDEPEVTTATMFDSFDLTLTVSSLALAGVLTAPGVSFSSSASELRVGAVDASAIVASLSVTEDVGVVADAGDVDLVPEEVRLEQLADWGHSMMGGDTAHMLDI
jgi:hypothetical protein